MKKRLSTPRAATVIVLAAVVALSVTVAPSIAASFLTSKAASQKYVSKKEAKSYLTKTAASKSYLSKAGASNYLTKTAAANTYLPKKGSQLQPTVAMSASNTLYSVNQSGSGYIPTAYVSFATKAAESNAVITFSGNASCSLPGKAPSVAQSCPITILVDGQPAASKVGFAPATNEGTTKEPVAALNHTVMITTVLGKGGHTIAVQYAGAAFLSFQLRSFNLAVQAYPQPEEELETTSTTGTASSTSTK